MALPRPWSSLAVAVALALVGAGAPAVAQGPAASRGAATAAARAVEEGDRILAERRDPRAARERYLEARKLAQAEAGDARARDVARVELALGNVAMIEGDRTEARARLEAGRTAGSGLRGPDRIALAAILDALAAVDVAEARLDDAARHLGDALQTVDGAVPETDARRVTPAAALARFHLEHGKPDDAARFAREAVARATRAFGEGDRRTIQPLLLLGRAEERAGRGKEGDAAFERALALAERAVPEADPERAFVVGAVGMHEALARRSERASELLTRALTLHERAGRGREPLVVPVLSSLALQKQQAGDPAGARALLGRAIEIVERAAGPRAPELVPTLAQAAEVEVAAGAPDKALALFGRARALQAASNAPMLDRVDVLVGLARATHAAGRHADAKRLLVEAADQVASAPGPASARALVAHQLGTTLLSVGELTAAREVLVRARDASGSLPPSGRELPLVLSSLARVQVKLADFAEAEATARRALPLWIAAEGESSPSVAMLHRTLADARLGAGDLAGGREAMARAVEIVARGPARGTALEAELRVARAPLLPPADAEREIDAATAIYTREGGEGAPGLAGVEMVRAGIASSRGDVALAERLVTSALARTEKRSGPDSPDVVAPLLALVRHAIDRRDLRRAALLLDRAVPIAERSTSFALTHATQLASVQTLLVLGQEDRATEAAQRAVQDAEERLGPDHPALVDGLLVLGLLESRRGKASAPERFARAELLARRALGEPSPALGVIAMGHGLALFQLGRGREAEPHLARAEQALARSPSRAYERSLVGAIRSSIAVDRGDAAAAVKLAEDAVLHSESDLASALGRGTDRENDEIVDLRTTPHRLLVDAQLRVGTDPRAARAAATAVLRAKERSRESAALSLLAARRSLSPADVAALDAVTQARKDAATLDAARVPAAAEASRQERATAAWQRVFELERGLAARGGAAAAIAGKVTVDDVAAALPQGSALVELVVYERRSSKSADAQERYAAYVIRPDRSVVGVDLGPVSEIDASARSLLEGAGRESATDASLPHARALHDRLLRPLGAALAGVQHLVVAPDGALATIPFGMLVDGDGRRVLERVGVSYVGSGRDLLPRPRSAPRSAPVVVSDPDFGERAASAGSAAGASLIARAYFARIPGTAAEARVIQRLLPDAVGLSGERATETALKELHGPRLLHVATHGFFLDALGAASGVRGFEIVDEPVATKAGPPRRGDPMTSSGLALAGANRRQSGADDGILSALEASSLDLAGTRLVVLSACQTGLGDAAAGHGVYGLRRALAVAGAESVVMTSWAVSDEVTATLMERFYRELAAGAGRAEALRTAQLAVASNPKTSHPYYWAAFVLAGDTRTLEGGAPPPPRPIAATPPGARGCACDQATSGASSSGLAAAGIAVAAAAARRRRRAVHSRE